MSAGRGVFARPAGGLLILRLACAACRLPAASRGRRFSLTPSRLLACTSEMQEFAASPAAARALCRRWARVLHLCFRPACLASFRFCEGFHACRLFARPVCCLRGFSLLSFAFSCLTFASQKSFHLSLMPRRAPHFLFGKKMGEKNREGLCPFEPHSSALRPISPFFWLLAGLAALRAANRRLTGKRLKSQGAELSFSSVSVRRGTPAPFRRSPPLPRCWPA